MHGKNTINELVLEVEGSQEAVQLVQLEELYAKGERNMGSMTTLDDDAWSEISVSSALSTREISMAMEEWVRVLTTDPAWSLCIRKPSILLPGMTPSKTLLDFFETFLRILSAPPSPIQRR